MLRGNLWAWECHALTCAELAAACGASVMRVLPPAASQLQEACFCRVRGVSYESICWGYWRHRYMLLFSKSSHGRHGFA